MAQLLQPGLEELKLSMFQQVPFCVAVIDRELSLAAANERFEEYFGEWRERRCHEVYKRAAEPCQACPAERAFRDGRIRVFEQTGVDRHGRSCQYAVHLAPLRDESGAIRYLIAMSTELTEPRS